MDDATWDRTVEKFDNEFKKYTSNKSSKSARAVTLARAELRNHRTLLWKDNKLKENKINEGRLTPERKELIEKRIVEIEVALDRFHQDVAQYNQLKAINKLQKDLEVKRIYPTPKYTHSQIGIFGSELDPIETLLSPTLSSFDFDDDSERMSDDEEVFLSTETQSEKQVVAGKDLPGEEILDADLSCLPRLQAYFHEGIVRTARAKTIGVCEQYGHDEVSRSTTDGIEREAKLRGILYRMTCTKSDATDLWTTKQHPERYRQDIARSLLVSMQMRETHVFEQLVVAGVHFHPDDVDVSVQARELSKFWKPEVFSAYPSCNQSAYDASIADFCFPKGVPVVACDTNEAQILRGGPITNWLLDAKALIENMSESVSSGYVFRLTGAKGEVLYGCCVAIMQEVLVNYGDQRKSLGTSATRFLAPVSYCLISKYPFYRLHFTILRMLVETQYGTKQTKNEYYKLPEGEHQNVNFAQTSEKRSCGVIPKRLSYHHLDMIAPNRTTPNGVIVVNENKPIPRCASESEKCSTQTENVDILTVVATYLPDSGIQVGDVLESVDGIATESIGIHETMELIQSETRPFSLRFRRGHGTEPAQSLELISFESIELLERMQTMKLGDPGTWTNVRLPRNTLEYLCPELAPERWAAIIAIRLIAPTRLVQILGALLLEKQMVIMGENVACVSAVCAALTLLLSPFHWQSTFIPLLPSHLVDFLHSPVPFLVGCHTLSSTCEWPDLLFYNIDNGELQSSNLEDDLSPIPDAIAAKLKQCLQEAKQSLESPDLENRQSWFELTYKEEAIVTLVLNQVSDLLTDLCVDFSLNYTREDNTEPNYEQLQEQLWRAARTSKYRVFLKAFVQTQMFCYYCENILKPYNCS
uniref:Uncharacterized protein AlNc14C246G9560 n=1 Tax=Albugo laibachii Nc14 TaxID=890382 RepID=F0WT75_9STRA|nr:conserved hypothetical protein [Albugo laibachii Nc14]|eukprot:CCA24563.1 conserved hypothetical protein [Albugo laibachii Nc14]